MNGLLQNIPPNIVLGGFLFLVLFLVVGTMTMNLLRANKREKLLSVLRNKLVRKKELMDGVLLSAQKRVGMKSNRVDGVPFELFNPVAINRDLRRAGLPQLWFLVYVLSVVLAFVIGFTVLNAPLERFPPYMQSLAIVMPCFYFVRHSVLGTLIERRRLRSLRQLVLLIESTQRAVVVGASAEDAVAEAIRDAGEPIRSDLMPIKDLLDLGYDFIEAISLAADRVNLPEFDIFVAALQAQSIIGGSIGDVLKEVAEIARSRLDLQKKVGTITAEGRFNAFLLGFLPIGLMMYLRNAQPDYFNTLWNSYVVGPLIFFMTVVGAVLGAYMAVRISTIKV
jgi:Flp pilus assembly protein TadB